MKQISFCLPLFLVFSTILPAQDTPTPLPPEAADMLRKMTEYEGQIRKQAESQIALKREQLVPHLQEILKNEERAGRTDSAAALKAAIASLSNNQAVTVPSTTPTGGTAAIPPGTWKDIEISAKEERGVSLGVLKSGTTISLSYKMGVWKSWGTLATENPDAEYPDRGDVTRLAIFAKKAGSTKLERLAIVPAFSAQKTFKYKIDGEFKEIFLRINEDEDRDWSANPGSVIYKVRLN